MNKNKLVALVLALTAATATTAANAITNIKISEDALTQNQQHIAISYSVFNNSRVINISKAVIHNEGFKDGLRATILIHPNGDAILNGIAPSYPINKKDAPVGSSDAFWKGTNPKEGFAGKLVIYSVTGEEINKHTNKPGGYECWLKGETEAGSGSYIMRCQRIDEVLIVCSAKEEANKKKACYYNQSEIHHLDKFILDENLER